MELEKVVEFYENGSLRHIGFKLNGEETGTWFAFYENGQAQYETLGGRFNCLGICDKGKVILINYWAEDGSQEVKNGYGTAYEYYENDDVLVGQFEEGLLQGYYREYRSGRLVHEAPCNRGLQHGIERGWSETGQLEELSRFHHGKRIGLSLNWDSEGRLCSVSRWVKGREVNIHWWDSQGLQTVRNGVGYHQSYGEINYFLFGRGTSFEMTLSEFGRQMAPSWMTKIDIKYTRRK
jgi:hypothetical protein